MGSAVEMGRWERGKEWRGSGGGGGSVSNQDTIGGKRQVVLNGYTSLEVAF